MNRVIKFRGKRKDNGEWVYGNYVKFKEDDIFCTPSCPDTFFRERHYIVSEMELDIVPEGYADSGNEKRFPDFNEVIPETVGQFTGLHNKNGVEIYEGDKVKFVGGTCYYLSMNHYGKKHEVGTVLVVAKLLSGYTLQLPIHVSEDIPNLVGNVDNYQIWSHQRSFEVIGNIHEERSKK